MTNEQYGTDILLSSIIAGDIGFQITSRGSINTETAPYFIPHTDQYGSFGRSITGGGDFNGDGYDDIVVGTGGNLAENGAVHVVYGGPSIQSGRGYVEALDLANGVGGLEIVGESTRNGFGETISFAGDVNNDGFDDVLVGAPFNTSLTSDGGAAYLIFGGAAGSNASSSQSVTDLVNNSRAVKFTVSDRFSSQVGQSVSSAGDVNGDGISDIIIGAPTLPTGNGYAYVLFGDDNFGEGISEIDLDRAIESGAGFRLIGEEPTDGPGYSVSNLGDVTGDNIDDFIVGAVRANGDSLFGGAAYVVFGREGLFPLGGEIDLSTIASGAGGFKISGQRVGEALGSLLANPGDINGDGVNDIAFSSNRFGSEATDGSGGVFVIFGSDELPIFAQTINAESNISAGGGVFIENLDSNVNVTTQGFSGAGDINGDGIDDMLFGNFDDFGILGGVHVVFGSQNIRDNNQFVQLSEVARGNGGFRIINDNETPYHLGEAVSAAGDINGDGFDDLIVATTNRTVDSDVSSGSAYILFGNSELGQSNGAFVGTDGDDRLISTPANEIVDAGIGNDTVVYDGARSDYVVFTLASGGLMVVDTRSNRDGSDTLENFENLVFSDVSLSVAEALAEPSDPDNSPFQIYRFYNTLTGTHFFTTSLAERNELISNNSNFNFEGNSFDSNATSDNGGAAVYRFFNTQTGVHFYTADAGEADNIRSNLPQFNDEGIVYYAHTSADAGGSALYRFYNTENGSHFFTPSEAERDTIIGTLGHFNYEGVAYYVDLA